MFNSFIGSVLSTILRRELEAICSVSMNWDSVVHEIHVLKSKLLHVLDESIVVVSFGHIVDIVFVELYRINL